MNFDCQTGSPSVERTSRHLGLRFAVSYVLINLTRPHSQTCVSSLAHYWNVCCWNVIIVCFDFEIFLRYWELEDINQSFMGTRESFTTQKHGFQHFAHVAAAFWTSVLCFHPLHYTFSTPASSPLPLFIQKPCVACQLPLHWRRAPNKTKQLSLPLLRPGWPLLSLLNSPLFCSRTWP